MSAGEFYVVGVGSDAGPMTYDEARAEQDYRNANRDGCDALVVPAPFMPAIRADRCQRGEHYNGRDAYTCDWCGAPLCEVCLSPDHRAGEGHDLSHPSLWGV